MRPYLIILSCLILISCKDQVHKKEESNHEHQVETEKTGKKKIKTNMVIFNINALFYAI